MSVIKFASVLFLASSLSGCGTFSSRDITDNTVRIRDYHVKTHCDEISHVYSGIQYDLCILDSDRGAAPAKVQIDPLWLTSVDFVFSAVADTFILPYTIFKQVENGNIDVVQ
jgi:uncharacterized protein YceK